MRQFGVGENGKDLDLLKRQVKDESHKVPQWQDHFAAIVCDHAEDASIDQEQTIRRSFEDQVGDHPYLSGRGKQVLSSSGDGTRRQCTKARQGFGPGAEAEAGAHGWAGYTTERRKRYRCRRIVV